MQFFILEHHKGDCCIQQDDAAVLFTKAALAILKAFLKRQNYLKGIAVTHIPGLFEGGGGL
jgi:hypothetical protein